MTKYKKITNDQWEGLQFELSELKIQMAQVLDLLGIEVTQALQEESELDDWGMDTKWQDREPQLVTPAGAPDGLELGPFVLTTPEERALILKNWDKKKKALEISEETSKAAQHNLLEEMDDFKKAQDYYQDAYMNAAVEVSELRLELEDVNAQLERLVTEKMVRNRKDRQLRDRMNELGRREFEEDQHVRNIIQNSWQKMVEEGPE